MTPDALPQQRIHEVVTLPSLPSDLKVYPDHPFPKEAVPKRLGRDAIYLCQLEWAWSPMNNRISAYYLHQGRSYWSLWERYYDENEMGWMDMPVSCCLRKGVETKVAAANLLGRRWEFESEEYDLDGFHWINEAEYLSVPELGAIRRNAWSEE